MNISKLQYITPQYTSDSFFDELEKKCTQGINWVQLRIKDLPQNMILKIAQQAQTICKQHEATFLINDYVDIAQKIDADGVHLGKNDMNHNKARSILGTDKIIGGTANTFADIQQLISTGVNYIGLGPFRFTTTKKNLSPIVGLNGYKNIVAQCETHGITTPIVAIGGIKIVDIAQILSTGIYGIAACELIYKSEIKELNTIFSTCK